MKTKTALACCLGMCLLLMTVAARAHDLWLMADQPAAGQPARLTVAFGHSFPSDQGVEQAKLLAPTLRGPQGVVALKAGDKQDWLGAAPLAPGSYVATAGLKPTWFSKTPEGYQDLPKDQTPGAISCVRSVKYAKALINLGGKPGEIPQPLGQTLEIVPLADPAGLKAGGELPVRVLFEGKPLAGAQVLATFASFSQASDTYAFAARAGKDGKALVKLWHPGHWLILVKHEYPYANPAECDKFMHSATLTFRLQ